MADMEKIIGRFKRISTENFDAFLKTLGVNVIFRKAATVSVPTMEVSKAGDTWSIKTWTTLRTMELTFRLGESFDEISPDGRPVTSVVTLEGNKFICIQTAKKHNQRSTKSIREFTGDRCIYSLEVIGCDPPVVTKLVFKRIEV